jgi:hypothetical protein
MTLFGEPIIGVVHQPYQCFYIRAKVFEGWSCRAFPEVPLVRRAAVRAFLVGVRGRSSRARTFSQIVFHFFPTPSFAGFVVFFFFSPSPPAFLFWSRSLSFFPRTTHATPTHPIAHTSCPYSVCLSSFPPTPLKTLSCVAEFTFVLLSQVLLSTLWAPHNTSFYRSTWNRWPTTYPLTPVPCISCLTLLPFLCRQARLHCTFFRSFLLGLRPGAKKVRFFGPHPCCFVFALALAATPQHSYTTYTPFSLSFTSEIPPLHLTHPFFPFVLRLCSHKVLGS